MDSVLNADIFLIIYPSETKSFTSQGITSMYMYLLELASIFGVVFHSRDDIITCNGKLWGLLYISHIYNIVFLAHLKLFMFEQVSSNTIYINQRNADFGEPAEKLVFQYKFYETCSCKQM